MSLPILLILLILVATAAVLLYFLLRPFANFQRNVGRLTAAAGATDRHQLPWVLMFGTAAARAELLCREAWNLEAIGTAMPSGRWWQSPEGGVLAFAEDGGGKDPGRWRHMLRALTASRARRPLDALLWIVDAAQLDDTRAATRLGQQTQRRLTEALHRCGLSLPVYVLLDGAERLPGLAAFSASLPASGRDAFIGWSNRAAPGAAFRLEWLDEALDRMMKGLDHSLLAAGALAGRIDPATFRITEGLEAWRAPLAALLEPVFRGNTLGEAHTLRGVYLSVSLPDTTASRQVPAHVARLLGARVFAERGLARPVPRLLAGRTRLYAWALTACCLLTVVWLCAMLWIWNERSTEADLIGRNLRAMQDARPRATASQEDQRHAVGSVASALTGVQRWRLGSWMLPGSWFSTLDARIAAALGEGLSQNLLQPLSDGLMRKIDRLLPADVVGQPPQARSGDPLRPEHWPELERVRVLVRQAAAIEHLLPGEDQDELTAILGMASPLYDINIDPARIGDRELVARLLHERGGAHMLDANLAPRRVDIAALFLQHLRHWLEEVYGMPRVVAGIRQLDGLLRGLQDGSSSPELLLAVSEELNSMHAELQVANAIRSATGNALPPEVRTLLDQARDLSLIGNTTVDDVLSYAENIQGDFRRHGLAGSRMVESVLSQSNGGELKLPDDLDELRRILAAIQDQPFARLVHGLPPGLHPRLDPASLTSARNIYDAYMNAEARELVRLPEIYRAGVMASLKDSTAANMAMALAGDGSEDDSVVTSKIATVQKLGSELADAFDRLAWKDFASELRANLRRLTLAHLEQAEHALLAQHPYLPRPGSLSAWDGRAGLAQAMFSGASAVELPILVAAQRETIAAVVTGVASSLDWLEQHRGELGGSERQLLERWKALRDELAQHESRNPANALNALEQLITVDLQRLTTANCHQKLSQTPALSSPSLFAERYRQLRDLALARCRELHLDLAATAYRELAGLFNRSLAGHFPFANDDPAAAAVDLAQALSFVRLAEARIQPIRDGLNELEEGDAREARRFIEGVERMRLWIGPLASAGGRGAQPGLELLLRWRTERAREIGGDQIIEWSLAIGPEVLRYPAANTSSVRWKPGLPLTLTLRWAANGPESPQTGETNAERNPDFSIEGRRAIWQARDPWALFRLLSRFRDEKQNPDGFGTLMLSLPTIGPGGPAQLRVFLQLTASSGSDAQPLPAPDFPSRAPASPFGSSDTADHQPTTAGFKEKTDEHA